MSDLPSVMLHFGTIPPVRAELASQLSDLTRGLYGRAAASPMLFRFSMPGAWPMTMTGMPFPLDFVFLADDGTVLDVQPNVPAGVPQVRGRRTPYRYVLELPIGGAAGILVGSRVGMTHVAPF